MGLEDIEAALFVTNIKRCNPPLAGDEVRKIAASGAIEVERKRSGCSMSVRFSLMKYSILNKLDKLLNPK
jgi:hypothetical protein